jgi:hypothetical protein
MVLRRASSARGWDSLTANLDMAAPRSDRRLLDPPNRQRPASRLQALTKSLGCEVVMSEEIYARAGFAADDLPTRAG